MEAISKWGTRYDWPQGTLFFGRPERTTNLLPEPRKSGSVFFGVFGHAVLSLQLAIKLNTGELFQKLLFFERVMLIEATVILNIFNFHVDVTGLSVEFIRIEDTFSHTFDLPRLFQSSGPLSLGSICRTLFR